MFLSFSAAPCNLKQLEEILNIIGLKVISRILIVFFILIFLLLHLLLTFIVLPKFSFGNVCHFYECNNETPVVDFLVSWWSSRNFQLRLDYVAINLPLFNLFDLQRVDVHKDPRIYLSDEAILFEPFHPACLRDS